VQVPFETQATELVNESAALKPTGLLRPGRAVAAPQAPSVSVTMNACLTLWV